MCIASCTAKPVKQTFCSLPLINNTLHAGKEGLLEGQEGLWGLPAGVDFRNSQSSGRPAKATAEGLAEVSPRTDCTNHPRKQETITGCTSSGKHLF